ncbi:MAG: release factor glutamine methyltransferase [Halieaceae bacterium]
MASVRELLAEAHAHAPTPAGALATANTPRRDDAQRDGEILLCAALGQSRSYLYAWPEAQVAADVAARYRHWLDERRRGVPVAYLLGEREFWSLSLSVDESTLIPRADTERLVEVALDLALPADAAVVDLGTGSGAIALALASERPGWRLTGTDISAAALAVARGNGERLQLLNVSWLCGHWFAPLDLQRFHLIACNPPYVAPDDPHLERGDLRFEPRSALVAAQDGMADLRWLVAAAPTYLEDDGWLLLEHGWEQGPAVRECLLRAGFVSVQSWHDLGRQERVSGGRWLRAAGRWP